MACLGRLPYLSLMLLQTVFSDSAAPLTISFVKRKVPNASREPRSSLNFLILAPRSTILKCVSQLFCGKLCDPHRGAVPESQYYFQESSFRNVPLGPLLDKGCCCLKVISRMHFTLEPCIHAAKFRYKSTTESVSRVNSQPQFVTTCRFVQHTC